MLVSIPGGSQGHVQVAIPVFVRHQLTFSSGVGGSGKLDITLGPKQTMGRNIEDARIEIPMPKSVLNCTLTATQVCNPSFKVPFSKLNFHMNISFIISAPKRYNPIPYKYLRMCSSYTWLELFLTLYLPLGVGVQNVNGSPSKNKEV